MIKFTLGDAKKVGENLKVDFSKISAESLLVGMNHELEHTDVTGGDPEATAKIALAHLLEDPKYYEKLEKSEKKNAKDWAKTYKAKFLEQGVCKYANETILIKNDAIFRMMNSIKGRPVVIQHQDITPDNMEQHACGYVASVEYAEYDASFHCGFVVFTDEGNQKVKDGWSVSCAYVPTEWGVGGEWHNVPYDREILNGEFTHLALVPNPRYEDIKIYENSKEKEEQKGETTIMFNLFKKKAVENQEELQNAVVEVPEVGDVSLKALVEAYQNAKKNEADDKEEDDKEKLNMDDEVDIDGEKVKVSDLVNCYKKNGKKNSDDEDEDDEKGNSEDEDKDDKKEDKEDKENKNSKDEKSYFFQLKNAAEIAANEELQNSGEYETAQDKVNRGVQRYGTPQKVQQ